MSAAKNERLLNLLICLLATSRYLTAERIRKDVPGYKQADGTAKSDESFKRMFERDKAELRLLGVNIETGTNSMFDTDDGYRVRDRDAKLPAIDLTPAETSAISLATSLWQSARMASDANGALRKLKAGGLDVSSDPVIGGIDPRLGGGHPYLDLIRGAVDEKREIGFRYRSAQETQSSRRRVQPWGVVSWRGRWYVVGFDVDKQAQRSFRLSRIAGEVDIAAAAGTFQRPDGVDLLGAVARYSYPERRHLATVRIHHGSATGLRRLARRWSESSPSEPIAADDSDVITVPYADVEDLATVVSEYGDAVEVLEPPDAREAIASRLKQLAAWTGELS